MGIRIENGAIPYQTNMGTSSCKGQQTGVDRSTEEFAANSCHCSAMPQVVWEIEDPSEFRPDFKLGKEKGEFRVFDNKDDERYSVVERTYREMHTKQTVAFVRGMREKWCNLTRCKMTIMEGLELLDQIVDESDPDTDNPNSFHCYQTAERIREVHPDKEWFHLTGLIHDVGKVLAVWGEPQFTVVGDTFPVGCAFSPKCVFPTFFKENPDFTDSRYNTKCGIYKPNCGLNEVLLSFGHDEYLYQVLVGNGCTLPEEALYMIRYHSFYPWHVGGDYDHLCNDKDRSMMKWVQEFNKFDLYSKADVVPDIDKLRPYYQNLIDKYIPGELRW